jgi:hypothetical protein
MVPARLLRLASDRLAWLPQGPMLAAKLALDAAGPAIVDAEPCEEVRPNDSVIRALTSATTFLWPCHTCAETSWGCHSFMSLHTDA